MSDHGTSYSAALRLEVPTLSNTTQVDVQSYMRFCFVSEQQSFEQVQTYGPSGTSDVPHYGNRLSQYMVASVQSLL